MPIRQRRENVSQKVRVTLVDVINSTAANFPALLQQKSGYQVLDDLTYELVGAQGDQVHILVKGTTIVAETYEEEKPVQPVPEQITAPAYSGDAIIDTSILDTGAAGPALDGLQGLAD